MSSNSFEFILEEVLNQKRILEELQAENEALRQQLADMHAGKGISIDILGQRYVLSYEEDGVSSPELVAAITTHEVPDAQPSQPIEPISDGETAFIDETPVPERALRDTSDDFLLEEISGDGTPFPATASSFLEEAMLEEFANATTRQMHVWTGPITDHPGLNEQEKASLRRELMGSFLLE